MIRYTRVLPGETRTIANGETITVSSIVVNSISFGAISTVNIYERDGTTLIMLLKGRVFGGLNPTLYFEATIPFVAQNGIVIDNSANTDSGKDVTIWYSQGGS